MSAITPEQRDALHVERRAERVKARREARGPLQPGSKRKRNEAPEGVRPELWNNPLPLLSEKLNLAMIWSPKSGCSFMTKWFFAQIDKEVEGWVHLQRRPFQTSAESIAAAVAFSTRAGEFSKLRVVRDPYDRAVSSYLHYLAQANKDNRSIGRDRDTVFAGRAQLSFRQFVDSLLSCDTSAVNVHWRPQTHPAERAGLFDGAVVVKLEDSMTELPRFESAHGLRSVDLAALRSSPHDSKREHEFDSFVGDTLFDGDLRQESPQYELFYDRALLDSVFELYREDFDRFRYAER